MGTETAFLPLVIVNLSELKSFKPRMGTETVISA